MDVLNVIEHSFLGLSPGIVSTSRSQYKALLEWKSSRIPVSENRLKDRFKAPVDATYRRGLFGTSGIRGIFRSDTSGHAVHQFIEENILVPKLAYFAGRAAAQLMMETGYRHPIRVIMDVRSSSAVLAMAAIRGIIDQNMRAVFGGIAPTPVYNLDMGHMTIVVTASHNPIEYNGLKFFWEGRPLSIEMENKLACIMTVHADLDNEGKRLKECGDSPELLSLDVAGLERLFFQRLRTVPEAIPLSIVSNQRLKHCFLPLDLAYGSAACASVDACHADRISPVIAYFMSLGVLVVGYGCIRDPERTNRRIGAAYAYGETRHQPRLGELAKFARGLFGYGIDAPRTLFLPESALSDNKLLTEKIEYLIRRELIRVIPVSYPEFTSQIIAIPMDQDSIPSDVHTELESEIMSRRPLPGLMVDCDADRILVTAPEIAKGDTPFLTGDGLLRFFAETAPPGTYSEIVFTTESGIALEKAMQHIRQRLQRNEEPAFNIKVVTVGDRAIIDYMMEQTSGRILGGEPSGHIIFGTVESEPKPIIIDDPFITYVRLLQRIRDDRFDLDAVAGRIYRDIPEIYCARKPDATGQGKGVSFKEKKKLCLWQDSVWGRLSDYAGKFIPAYVDMFAEMYSEAFGLGGPPRISMSAKWGDLVSGRYRFKPDFTEVTVAEIHCFRDDSEHLKATLRVNRKSWAGPETIHITFYLATRENTWIKMGEGVFRNSGTSPKNAGYHKLWHIHPTRNIVIPETRLRDLLDVLAKRRAQWTDRYILNVLRRER